MAIRPLAVERRHLDQSHQCERIDSQPFAPASYAPMAVAPPNSRVPDRGAPDTRTPRRPRKEAAKCVEHSYGQSASFKALVDEVEGLPGIVYIDATVAVPRGLDGALLHRVAGSRDLPILRVQLRWNLSAAEGISTLAHELQHVAEVLRTGQTLDCSGMSAFLRQSTRLTSPDPPVLKRRKRDR